jgi:hypothetical protein
LSPHARRRQPKSKSHGCSNPNLRSARIIPHHNEHSYWSGEVCDTVHTYVVTRPCDGIQQVLVVWVCEQLLPYRYLDDQHLVIDSCDHTAARNCNLVSSKGCCYNVLKNYEGIHVSAPSLTNDGTIRCCEHKLSLLCLLVRDSISSDDTTQLRYSLPS